MEPPGLIIFRPSTFLESWSVGLDAAAWLKSPNCQVSRHVVMSPLSIRPQLLSKGKPYSWKSPVISKALNVNWWKKG